MKLQRIMAAALIAMGMATMAHADAQVWFTAAPGPSTGGVDADGAAGANTALSCETLRCDWDVTMWIRPDRDWVGWHVAIGSDDPTVSIKSVELLGGNGFTQDTGPTFSPDGIDIAGQIVITPPVPGNQDYAVMQFRLSKEKDALDMALSSVYAAVAQDPGGNSWGFIGQIANDASIFFGANAGVSAGYGVGLVQPVISIQNVPEPVSLALLGMGALALVRRRR